MLRFYLLCFLWYSCSAVTNNISKEIMAHKIPITLTWIQFGFVSCFSMLYAQGLLNYGKIREPSRAVIGNTLPLGLFQIFGHYFTSTALAFVPVSFAHTIKALSPLFTVLAYRIFYQVRYSKQVYFSLLPLTSGVMLVCATNLKFHSVGFIFALASMFTFVSQNIVCKQLFKSHGDSVANQVKLDKLNLLFYPSTMAFVLMTPFWLYSEAHLVPKWFTYHTLFLFILNGISHFLQNVLAFTILSHVSPVTYSIASLVKRIFVITASILYFGDPVSFVQGSGISLTFFGLWLYNEARRDVGNKDHIQERKSSLPFVQS
ncbi:triose-phosphate transporter family-domain-containing protein [Gorgonomyces haynaldii]|nr:triose-phosphate transporter family-domain-containing protein [Gorgonomyces haynaldii]